jgi:hypothetical protein
VAGVADLTTSLFGVRMAGLVEGNPHFIPFLTEAILIAYIFTVRKFSFFPKKTEQFCELLLVVVSFAPAIWNLALIFNSFA